MSGPHPPVSGFYMRRPAESSFNCRGCGRLILIGDPIYKPRRKDKRRDRRSRFCCGACCWRRVMTDYPKWATDGWPAQWAQEHPTPRPNVAGGGGAA